MAGHHAGRRVATGRRSDPVDAVDTCVSGPGAVLAADAYARFGTDINTGGLDEPVADVAAAAITIQLAVAATCHATDATAGPSAAVAAVIAAAWPVAAAGATACAAARPAVAAAGADVPEPASGWVQRAAGHLRPAPVLRRSSGTVRPA